MGARADRRRKEPAENRFDVHFVDGAVLEVTGPVDERYHVQFVDTRSGHVVHEGEISTNHWIRTARRTFTPWHVIVRTIADGKLRFSHRIDCTARRVYVAFESKALGDTLAWMPAVDEFQRRHGCRLICSTFMNDLFRRQYRNIRFVEPGTVVNDLYALYRLGWFYRADGSIDLDRNAADFRAQPLGAAASDILGVPYVETRPRLRPVAAPRPIVGPYVCIAVHATAQAKYWNHEHGWTTVTRFLRDRGFTVVLLSRDGAEFMGNSAPEGVTLLPSGPLSEAMRYLHHATMFIGIGSGLSWLAWAVGCRVCLISGFSLPHAEMTDCVRIVPPPGVCTGCFHTHRLDPGQWDWCPEHRGTPRAFECTRRITPERVIEAIRPYL